MMNCKRILKQVFTGTGRLLMKMLKLLYEANLIAMKQMILLKMFVYAEFSTDKVEQL